jgi:hypothetical protein
MSYKLKLANGDVLSDSEGEKLFDSKDDAKAHRADFGLPAKVIEE